MSTEDKYKDKHFSKETMDLLKKTEEAKKEFHEQIRRESELVSDIIFAIELSCMAGEPYQEHFEKLSKYVYQTGGPLVTPEVLREYEALEDFIRKIEGNDELSPLEVARRARRLYKNKDDYDARMEEYYKEHPELEGQIIEPVGPLRK